MGSLCFQFFGPPCFKRNGLPVKLGRKKAAALAVYLVVTGKPHSRDHLADLFWQTSDREKARASLRRTLFVITKALGRFWLSVDRDTIGYTPHKALRVDVLRFRELTAGADTPEALQEAASIYENGFLNGFSLKGAPDFNDWQFEQEDAFGRSAARVFDSVAQWCMRRMDYAGAISYAQQRVSLDPFDETAHRQLIRFYHGDGQQRAAIHQYEKCRDILQKELGIDPDDKTEALAVIIRGAAPGQANPQLPAPSTLFVGRKHELRTLTGMVKDPGTRLVTLTGPGGIGKTRLALEAAAGLKDGFSQGAFFIPLGELTALEPAHIIRSLGLCIDGKSDPLEQLLTFLGHGKRLLVLDNFENLDHGGMLVSKMLDRSPGLKVMVTSRTRLMLKGEHLFPLSGLICPDASPVKNENCQAASREYDAPALFLSAAGMVKPDFKLSASNFEGVVRICELTGGLPLALILAAGWIDIYSPDKIAKEIRKSLGFLKTGLRDIPSSHKSMRAVFDASWNRLPEREKRHFLRLSVFNDGFSLDSATAVCGNANDTVSALVRKSMLGTGSVSGRFQMHPLLRQYGREELLSRGRYQEMMDRHKTHYLDMACKNGAGLIGDHRVDCRRNMDADYANIRQAWFRAVDQGDLNALSHAAEGIYIYFDTYTQYHEGETLFQAAKELLMTQLESIADPNLGVLLLCWLDMQTRPPGYREIKRAAEHCLRIAVRTKNSRAKAYALLLMGAVAHRQKLFQRAIRFYELSSKTDPDIEHSFWVSVRIGLCRRMLGDMDRAIDCFRQSRETGFRFGDVVKQAWSLGNIGSAELCRGNLDKAESRIASAEKAFRRLNAPVGIVTSLEELALISFLRGDIAQAVTTAEQASEVSKHSGLLPSRYQRALALKGLALLAARETDQARLCLTTVLKTGTPNFTAHIGMVFWGCLKGNEFLAREHLNSAEKSEEAVNKPQLRALYLLASAAVAVLAGEDGNACELLSTLFHHQDCPNELFGVWDLPGSLVSKVKSKMSPLEFKKRWDGAG
ncbi:MAG: hypothetical protein MI863_25590 [Desulfobacterales bacterium]|nr:hypothetical protein [Desulfobacterales bacterium]